MIPDDNDVYIWARNKDGDSEILVAVYNGKDSIPSELNNEEVDYVRGVGNEMIDIGINMIATPEDAIDLMED